MARKADPPQVRLLLEPEHDNPRSLDTAWFLARQLGAVLNSILLENPDLFHIAGLPVTHEVRLTGHDLQPMDARSMEREYLLLAGRLQQAIEKRVGKSGIRCTFRRARESRQQVLTSRDQAIQVIGNPGRAVWSERPAAGGPRRWSLLYEEGAGSRRALQTACALLQEPGAAVSVFIRRSNGESYEHILGRLLQDQALRQFVQKLIFRAFDQPDEIRQAVRQETPDALILARELYFTGESWSGGGVPSCPLVLIP